MTDYDRAQRRIMNRLGEDNRIPVINIREGDVGVLLGFPLAGLLIGSLLNIGIVTIGLLFTGLTIGTALVYAAPPQLTAWDWLTDVLRYVTKRPRVTHSYRTADTNPTTEGGLVQYTPFSVDESTQDLTNVRRAWPGANAIERTDGTMEAFIELEPANMDFAMSDDWAAVQRAGEEFANNELGFPLTMYATTRSFPVERLVKQLDDRLEDEDVQANPVFGELIEEYQDKRPDDLADAQELHYYLGVEVDRIEVYKRYGAEQTPGEKLTKFPIIGFLFNPFVTRREQLEESELRAAMFEKLDDRIETVRSEFIDNVSGWTDRRLTTVEIFLLLTEFWNGEELSEDHAEQLIRTEPAVSRSPREDDR
ncbi:hypothetical protein HWV23_10485 [Natronomonas halophila]|uniref:hypothetical protein n=1 Tax=Natronomonas halophila TaxID=2747817 RepID=UPI0015B63310|nr:hypothetical protein [Natronomonas halophila]QLD86134.1 hypothetical protein HWV23_10485 [Natronomonas halophila]